MEKSLPQSFKQSTPATIPFCSRVPTISGISASIHHTAKLGQNSITEDAQENTIQIGKYMGLDGLVLKGCSLGSEFLWHVTRWQVSDVLTVLTLRIRVFYHHPDFKNTVSAGCYQYQRVIFHFIHVTKAHVCYVVIMGRIYSSI